MKNFLSLLLHCQSFGSRLVLADTENQMTWTWTLGQK